MIELTLKRAPTVPLEAELLSPDVLESLPEQEIRGLRLFHGKRQLRVDDFFEVSGGHSDHIKMRGDLTKVRWLGRGMTKGKMHIEGSVGMHLGAYMRGGSIEVTGDASDWLGAEMKNGFIRVTGNAGGQIGGAYRGSLSGMKNGVIHIGGTAGLEVGLRMRRGTIVVEDVVRDFAGLQMKGGTIVLLKGAEIRTGAWMNRGTIISLAPLQLMPTFKNCGLFRSPFVHLLLEHLKTSNVSISQLSGRSSFERYVGDISIPGKGEILIWQPDI